MHLYQLPYACRTHCLCAPHALQITHSCGSDGSDAQYRDIDYVLSTTSQRLGKWYSFKPLTARVSQLEPSALTTFNNISTLSSALNSLDCYALGIFNYMKKEYSKAEVWFNISLTLYDKSDEDKYNVYDFSEKHIHKWLGVLLVRRWEHSLGVWHLNQAKDILDYDDEMIALAIIKGHCSASFQRPTHLHCRYNNWMTPFLRIAPLKLEELSLDPLIVLYYKAIYNSEIETLLKRQEYNLISGKDNMDRTIHERVADMSGLNLDRSEVLSVINNDNNGHFQLQEDAPKTVYKLIYPLQIQRDHSA